MKWSSSDALQPLWTEHQAQWRDPIQVLSHWPQPRSADRRLLRYHVSGAWWETLASTGVTLLVSREYEHLVVALRATPDGPALSYVPLPHPSGIAVDREQNIVYLASTRNPNLVYDLAPVSGSLSPPDRKTDAAVERPLVPLKIRVFPGCLYLHDLALIEGRLYANAVGQNAIVRLDTDSRHTRVWWPRCIERSAQPVFEQNHIQLNSIAPGQSLARSYFSASTDRLSSRRPGHLNFPVDRRGVVFSGATREPVARGLTRPHSARLYHKRVWVDNSGYGEFGFLEEGGFTPIVRLQGWTRGLCFVQGIAFVGTSRVIPRFARYAPGLNCQTSVCGIHAIDIVSGCILGSLIWPNGNQIFAIEWLASQTCTGLPFSAMSRTKAGQGTQLFYAFSTQDQENHNP